MQQSIFSALLNNAALLMILCIIYELTYHLFPRPLKKKIAAGILIALACIGIMSMTFSLSPGIVFDTRSILISVTALIFGPITTAITVAAAIVYRFFLGGMGALPGVVVILSSAVIGLTWRQWAHVKTIKLRWFHVYIMGLVVHIAMIACMFLMPYPQSINVVREITFPVIIIYPVATALLYLLLTKQQAFWQMRDEIRQSELKLRQLLETMSQGVVCQSADGKIISANPEAERILGLSLDQLRETSLNPNWKTIYEDGTEMPGTEHPAMIVLRTVKPYGPVVMGVFQPKLNDHVWLSVNATPIVEADGTVSQVYTIFQDITAEKKAKHDYQLLFNLMVDGFALHEIICDEDGKPVDYRFLTVNPAFERIVGLKASDIIGKTVLEILPDTEPYWIETYGKVALTGEPVMFENYNAATDKHFRVTAYQPAPMQFACTFSDDTLRIKAEEELFRALARLRGLLNNSNSPIIIFDDKGNIVEISVAAEKIIGLSRREMLGKNMNQLGLSNILNNALQLFNNSILSGQIIENTDVFEFDGEKRYFESRLFPIATKQPDERLFGYLGVDVTDRIMAEKALKEREAELIDISKRDYLTGVYNRRYFEAELKRMDEENLLPLSIIIGDINGVKFINDAFGHAAGDKLILQTAKILSDCCREGDVLARTDGDEFSILMPNTDHVAAMNVMRKIRTTMEEFDAANTGVIYQHSISLGCATKAFPEEDIKEVLKIAEGYMYQRKLLEHDSAHSALVASIRATLFEKSHETEEHTQRLISLSKAVGMALDLPQSELDKLELLASLHDIGKVGVRDEILTKPGKLNEMEWVEIKRHPEIGYRIATTSPELSAIAEGILSHHEWWNGSGYPQGLRGENIPLISRIVAVVDAYDAMTNDRPYRKALSYEKAIEIIKQNAGIQFDPQIVKTFLEIMKRRNN